MDTTANTNITTESTYCMFIDALPATSGWAINITGDSTESPHTGWNITLTVQGDGPSDPDHGRTGTLNHEAILAAMRKIVADRPDSRLASDIQSVLDAQSVEEADDAACQLDADHFDAIVQFAVLGRITYR